MADISKIVTLDGSEYNIKDTTARTVMTGATSSSSGTSGAVPAPTTLDVDRFLKGDGTWADGGRPMVILSYGSSTWSDFIDAYNNNAIVYARASSNSNPANGSQTCMAFMAYVNSETTPTEVEFQYYRSLSSHSVSSMCDEVYVYKLNKTNGWSVTTRQAGLKQITASTGSHIDIVYSNSVITISDTLESKTAASGGTDVSLVTTGEKYAWNNKMDSIEVATIAEIDSLFNN